MLIYAGDCANKHYIHQKYYNFMLYWLYLNNSPVKAHIEIYNNSQALKFTIPELQIGTSVEYTNTIKIRKIRIDPSPSKKYIQTQKLKLFAIYITLTKILVHKYHSLRINISEIKWFWFEVLFRRTCSCHHHPSQIEV